MNIKYVVLSVFAVKSIMAAKMASEAMAEALIAAKDDALEVTFKKLEEEQDGYDLHSALADMAQKEHIPKVVRCLEMANDPFPKEESRTKGLVNAVVETISIETEDTEAFAGFVASFKPSAVKLLAAIRHHVLYRKDAKNVLELVMTKSPELITGSLPRWLAVHGFDRSSIHYSTFESAREQTFNYLVSHANRSIISEAVDIAKKNEHCKVDSRIICCTAGKSLDNLIINLKKWLLVLYLRDEMFAFVLTFLPIVLIPIIGDYLGVDMDSLSMLCPENRATQSTPALDPSPPTPNSVAKKTLGKRKRDNRARRGRR